jgi:F0F1-type ATP synthase delta subunit
VLKGVAHTALELHDAAAKTVSVTVSSAVKLSDAQQSRIIKSLPKYTGSSNFNVEFEV